MFSASESNIIPSEEGEEAATAPALRWLWLLRPRASATLHDDRRRCLRCSETGSLEPTGTKALAGAKNAQAQRKKEAKASVPPLRGTVRPSDGILVAWYRTKFPPAVSENLRGH